MFEGSGVGIQEWALRVLEFGFRGLGFTGSGLTGGFRVSTLNPKP